MRENCRLRRGIAYRQPADRSASALRERDPLAHVVALEGVHQVLRLESEVALQDQHRRRVLQACDTSRRLYVLDDRLVRLSDICV